MAAREKGARRPEPLSPDLYTREYFTTDCEGYDLFVKGEKRIPERIEEALEAAGDLDGRWILDIGCGRGELVCEAALRGAHAVGIDYSEAAIGLSRERSEMLEPDARSRIRFDKADAKGLAFEDGSFDVVFMVDVYEHLHQFEIEHTLREVSRVLRPGGSLIVHTGPNTWFYRFGYPLVRESARLLLHRELPENLRGQYDDIMHVNEQSPLSLYRDLRSACFTARVLPRSFLVGINPNRWERAVMRLLFARPLGYFFCTSLMAEARPREGGREAQLRVNRVLRMLRPPLGARVLLVGDAEGKLAGRLSGMAEVEVTWLEPAEVASTEARPSSLEGGDYLRLLGDVASLPFPDDHFDAVAAQFTVERASRPESAVAEWHRVLRQGGTLALVAHNSLYGGWEQRPGPRRSRDYSPRDLASLVERAGFATPEVSTLVPDLKLPALYRRDMGFSLCLEKIPFLSRRGRLLFLSAVKSGVEAG